MYNRIEIKNRNNKKIVVIADISENQKGLAFVTHGLGGFKEQPHIITFAEAFKEKDYTVIRFDTTNTFGESDGLYEYATATNYYEDLEDVIKWAKKQVWYQEPFCLCGHSLGGLSIGLYAENHPNEVKALVPISTVVSGKLSLQTPRYKGNDILEKWEKTGWNIKESNGKIKKLPWSHIEDRIKYDLLDKVDRLKMPVLLIVGEQDDSTPPEHQKIFYEKLSGLKELHIIKNAPHTLKDKSHLKEIKEILLKWISKL